MVSIDDDADDSSVDNDDDISSDEETRDALKSAPEEPKLVMTEAPPTRTAEDLQMYQKFFAEQFEVVVSYKLYCGHKIVAGLQIQCSPLISGLCNLRPAR